MEDCFLHFQLVTSNTEVVGPDEIENIGNEIIRKKQSSVRSEKYKRE